ncbi:MAG TPA: hypothetical protein VFS20_06170 [Longimicrobium sp.]|nr:hypothetical protein [Longimicrobium sp.]
MFRSIRVPVSLTLLFVACRQSPPPESSSHAAVPQATHVLSDARAEAAKSLGRADPATPVGAYVLIRDAAALARTAGRAADAVDFSRSNVLALRVPGDISAEDAAPRVFSRNGFTFVVLRRDVARRTGGDRVELFDIPVTGGPVRYVAYSMAEQSEPQPR